MDVILLILTGLGLAFDVLAISVAQGSVLGKVVARNMILMCLIVCGWQVIACGLGYLLSVPLMASGSPNAALTLLSALIFIAEGGIKLLLLHYRKNVEETVQEIDFKRTCGLAASTSIYTFFAGFACGILSVSTVALGIMICVMTIALVIIGIYVGYQNGELDKRVYRTGGILLIIAGGLIVVNYVMQILGMGGLFS